MRWQLSERKELSEICEVVMDKCCAPDADIGAGVGCDNMTMMIVALLNGRTKVEWYDWIAKRVEANHGHETPKEWPQLYDPSRIAMAQNRQRGGGGGFSGFRVGPPALGLVARSFAGGGGIAGGLASHGISSDMFDDSDETDDDEAEDEGSGWFWSANSGISGGLSASSKISYIAVASLISFLICMLR